MAAIGAAGLVLLVAPAPARATGGISLPPAPKPTSTAVSPEAPDPHPPAGARTSTGSVPGGYRLASRGTVVPAGAPKLPAGVAAQAWLLCDLGTGKVLAARDPHGRYQPASILKMLTAVTIAPHLPGNKVITISRQAAAAEGSAVGLLAGARYSVDQLFAAMLLVSGNDAATALAEANGGVPRTVAQMNAEAAALGAYDTYVQTPSGLDGWQQLTSAYDMALVLRATIAQPRLLRYDQQRNEVYPGKVSKYGQVGSYEFDNQSNDFFGSVPGGLLAKIGYTDAAQHTYLAAARRGGRTLGIVFLRDTRYPLDQYQQAARLFNWGFALKPTVPPIGVLAGPITQSAASPPASAPAEPTLAPQARSGAQTQLAGRRSGPQHQSAIIGAGGAGLLVVAISVAAQLRSRRRTSRRR